MQYISSVLTFADYFLPINKQTYFHLSIILFMKKKTTVNGPEQRQPISSLAQERKQNNRKEREQERREKPHRQRMPSFFDISISISRSFPSAEPEPKTGRANLASYIKSLASTCLFLLLPRRPHGPAMTSQPAGGANPPMASVQELVMSPSQ